MPEQPRGGEWSGLALLASGVVLVGSILGGYWLGQALDSAWGTGSRWSIIGVTLGAVVGFWQMFRIALWVISQQPPIAPKRDRASDAIPLRTISQDEDETGRSS